MPAALAVAAALADVPLEEATDSIADRVRARLNRLRPPFRIINTGQAVGDEPEPEEEEVPPTPRKKFLGVL